MANSQNCSLNCFRPARQTVWHRKVVPLPPPIHPLRQLHLIFPFPFRRSMPFIGLALAILFIAIYRIIALNNPSSATPTSSFDTIRPDLCIVSSE